MAKVQAIFMQDFSSLALKVREEFEVTDLHIPGVRHAKKFYP